MAYDIGPKIGIDGEADFRKQINEVNQSIKTLGTEMKVVTSAFSGQEKSEEQLTAENKVLTQSVGEQEKKLELLKQMLAQAEEKYGETDEITQKWKQTVNNATVTLNESKKKLHENEEALDNVGKETGDAEQGMGELSKETDKAGKSMEEGAEKGLSFGDVLKANLASEAIISGVKALASAIKGIANTISQAVETGMDFDKSMSQVAATMGYTVDEINTAGSEAAETFEALRGFAVEMGSATAFSASEAAEALNYMALAGYDAETSMTMLPTVLDLAAAGGMALATASDMVTDTQSALGLSLEETAAMVDQMAKASSKSNTSVTQLGEAFLKIGATARSVNGGTEELATILGVLADNGIKGSEGGTHLRNILLSLQDAAENGAVDFGDFAVSVYDADGNMRSMVDIIGDIQTELDGMTQEAQDAIISGVFNKTDLASVNALLGTSSDRFEELGAAIADSSNAAAAMAETQLDNLAGDITLFQSALDGAKITISNELTPGIRKFVQFGTNAIGTLTEAFQEGGLSGAVEAFGGILSEAVGLISEAIPQIARTAAGIVKAIGQALADNAPLLTQTALDLILDLTQGLLSSEGITNIANTASEILTDLVYWLAEYSGVLIDGAVDIVLTLTDALTDPENIVGMVDAASVLLESLADGVIKAIPKIVEAIPVIVDNIVTALTESIPIIIDTGVELLVALVEALPEIITTIVEAIPKIIDSVVVAVYELIPQIIDAGVKLFVSLVDALPEIIATIVKVIPKIISGIVTAISKSIPQIIEAGINLLVSLVTALPQIILTIVAAIPRIIASIANAVMENIDTIIEAGVTLFVALVKNLPVIITEIVKAVPQIVTSITNAFSKFLSQMVAVGEDLIKGVWQGICNKADWLKEKISNWLGGVVDGIKDFLGIASPSKVFAGIGGFMAEGLGDGFEDEMKAVKKGMVSAIPIPDMSLADVMSGTVNGMQTAVAGMGGEGITVKLMLPDGNAFASYYLPSFINTARANGTPILNPA